MAALSDEILMAYADGQLDAVERARVEALLASDPDSRRRLAVFEATGARLAEAYAEPLSQAAPRHLVEAIMAGPVRSPTAMAQTRDAEETRVAEQQSLWARFKGLLGLPAMRMSAVLAGSGGLVVGGLAGWLLHASATSDLETRQSVAEKPPGASQLARLALGEMPASPDLQAALEARPSGVAADLWLRLTFVSRDRGYCRQYVAPLGPQAHAVGVGCRGEDGIWRIVAHQQVAGKAPVAGKTSVADGSDPPLIDSVVKQLKVDGDDGLDAKDEAAAIARRWQTATR